MPVNKPVLSPSLQLDILTKSGVPSFEEHLAMHDVTTLQAEDLAIFQVNVGKLCNQICSHCHVDAGPHQTTANMDLATFDACLNVIRAHKPRVVDITGGAPELNPHFRYFVRACRDAGVQEIYDRCNLSVLLLKSQQDLAAFLAEHHVHVIASLPAVNERQTDQQRGDGIFKKSIEGLQRLNEQGYGRQEHLQLTLVSNPAGAFLPAGQEAAERRFKQLLEQRYGIQFNHLLQITNLPISRFLEFLQEKDLVSRYLRTLSKAFNPAALEGLMCKNTLSVSWDGRLFDCDFNQMLDLPAASSCQHISDYSEAAMLGRPIVTHRHCLGCTAGQGSSCGGKTTA